MGRSRRPRPIRLAEKLKQIRLYLKLSQEGMVKRLDYDISPLISADISLFENDKKEPPVQLILYYARSVNIPMEVLVDDEMDLPDKFTTRIVN